MPIFLIPWAAFVFFTDASYECNLRAYLMSVDFERRVDTALDLVQLDRDLFFPPGGTHNWHLLHTSLDWAKRLVADRAKEKELFLHFFDKGKLSPSLLEQHILNEGQCLG